MKTRTWSPLKEPRVTVEIGVVQLNSIIGLLKGEREASDEQWHRWLAKQLQDNLVSTEPKDGEQ